MKEHDSQTWYRPPATRIGFVEMYHHQLMWENRTNPRIHRAFAQLWGTNKLWCSIDRVCLKLPTDKRHPDFTTNGFVHWDLDPWEEKLPFGLQGVLCLEDTDANQGGFHCVPGMHRWVHDFTGKVHISSSVRDKFHNRGIPINVPEAGLKVLNVKKIPAKAGDLIIWRRELAHGNGQNLSSRPRIAQYICMYPARSASAPRTTPQECLHPEPLHQRIQMWRENGTPDHKPGDKRRKEEDQPTATLTPLGERLLGLVEWEEDIV